MPVTRKQAEAALASVKAQWKTYLEPMEIDGETYPPSYPEPVIVEDWTEEGHTVIVWEEGPDEWAMRVSEGGPAESDYVLAHSVAQEFGVPYDSSKVTGVKPAPKWPKTVYGEPYSSSVLALYPA